MNRLCGSKVVCDDPNLPITNFSSEAPDREVFIATINGVYGVNQPPLGSNFTINTCTGVCEGETLEQAEACALAALMLCIGDHVLVPPNSPLTDPPNTPPNNPTQVFQNSPQTCTVHCPDGLPFSFTVGAGRYTALSQAVADSMAHSFACTQASLHLVCMGSLSRTENCSGSPFSGTIIGSAGTPPLTFAIVAGALPPGLTLSSASPTVALISGTPITAGTYQFRIRATDVVGDFMEKLFSITIISIATTSPLPSAAVGVAYSETLALSGSMQGTPVWSIAAGALPVGLSLNASTGEISGTALASGTSSFTVAVTDSRITCSKDFQLVTTSADCGTLPSVRTSKTVAASLSWVSAQRGGTLFIEARFSGTNTFFNLRDVRDMNLVNTNALGARHGPPFGGFSQSSGKWAFVDLNNTDSAATIYRVAVGAGASTTTTVSFVIPNVGNNVQITVASTTGFNALDTVFILGVTYSIVSVDSPVKMTIQNLTATPGPTVNSGTLVSDGTGYAFTVNTTAWPINLTTTPGSGRRAAWANNSNGLVYFTLAGTVLCFNTATNAIVATASPDIGNVDLNGVTVDEATGNVYLCAINFATSTGLLYKYDSVLGSFVSHNLPNAGNIGSVNSPVFSPSSGLVYVPTEDSFGVVTIYAVNPTTGASVASIAVPTAFGVNELIGYSHGGYDLNSNQAYFGLQSNITFGSQVFVVCTTSNTLLGQADASDAFNTGSFFSYEDHFNTEIMARNNGGATQSDLERYSP